jgi:hypothetical protein
MTIPDFTTAASLTSTAADSRNYGRRFWSASGDVFIQQATRRLYTDDATGVSSATTTKTVGSFSVTFQIPEIPSEEAHSQPVLPAEKLSTCCRPWDRMFDGRITHSRQYGMTGSLS